MRLVEGANGWWCIAPSGIAFVPGSLVHNGHLTARGRTAVDHTGITATPAVSTYALTVLTTTECNLGCAYCFQNTEPAGQGRFDPQRIGRTLLSTATVDSIATFTRERMRAAGLRRLYVLLFGGEPLLNPTGCTELLLRCRDLGQVSAGMVSNATLLRPRLATRLCQLGLASVQVTLDGPRPVHDAVRTTRGGRPTFDRILAAVAAVQDATALRFTIRINVTPSALPGLAELICQLAERIDTRRSVLQLARLTGDGLPAHQVLDPSRQRAAQFVAIYAHARAHGFRLPLPAAAPCAFCTERDGRHGAVINADGGLYSCWETAGRPGFELGTAGRGYRAYPSQRWVRCATTAGIEHPAAARQFADTVDAGLLDLLDSHRRDNHARTAEQPQPAVGTDRAG